MAWKARPSSWSLRTTGWSYRSCWSLAAWTRPSGTWSWRRTGWSCPASGNVGQSGQTCTALSGQTSETRWSPSAGTLKRDREPVKLAWELVAKLKRVCRVPPVGRLHGNGVRHRGCMKIMHAVCKNYRFCQHNFYFLQLYCPSGISPMGNSGCLPWGKPAMTHSRNPSYGACWVF